jgi:hypothetical protein
MISKFIPYILTLKDETIGDQEELKNNMSLWYIKM